MSEPSSPRRWQSTSPAAPQSDGSARRAARIARPESAADAVGEPRGPTANPLGARIYRGYRCDAGGAVLTRAKIGTLNKAEARAYLASMRQAPVRGNRQDLIERLTSIFEMNRIDAYRTGDHLSHMYPAVRFSDEIPSLDSEPDSEGYCTS